MSAQGNTRGRPFINIAVIDQGMAMIDIEYRHTGRDTPDGIRRRTWEEMEKYLRGLVYEMQEADISSKYIGTESEKEDMVYINGKTVPAILEGLEIKAPMPDEDECGCGGSKPIVIQSRPTLDWNEGYIEDIPDILMKNAISKVYCDINRNRIM